MLERILIRNYRGFRDFELTLNSSTNILVGDNESGKSTLLEAINLALTGRLGGRPFSQELSPFLINQEAAATYVSAVQTNPKVVPPEVVIDLFIADSQETAILKGSNNLLSTDAAGTRIHAYLDPDVSDEYQSYVEDASSLSLVPTEYYRVDWLAFSGNRINPRRFPVSVSLIDASSIRLQSGVDYYLQNIIEQQLDRSERIELARSYRSMREEFSDNDAVVKVNERLAEAKGDVTGKDLSLSIDISNRFTWEKSLTPHVDDLPFQFIGLGEQSTLKILLGLNRKLEDAHVVLIEEPENHLSFSTLNVLMAKVIEKCEGKQVLVSTHSSYVLNKLGLESLVLLRGNGGVTLESLPSGTQDYFKKLSGYDTLRLVLAKKAILVEGPSDELVVQRAYLDAYGRLPIQDGIDVINVRGLSFRRFLDLAVGVQRETIVVTDNDGRPASDVEAAYSDYVSSGVVSICVGEPEDGETLEPQLLKANSLDVLNEVFATSYATEEELVAWMAKNKTSVALKVLESEQAINMPDYITDAVGS